MENNQINEEVLIAYLKGEMDASEIAQVESWYDASEQNRKMLSQIYYLLYIGDRLSDSARIDVEASLLRLKTRINVRQHATSPFRRIAWRVAAAAVIALAVVTGGWSISTLSDRLSKPFVILTQLGERSQVLLPDGTKVWLNSCSRVEYSNTLFSRERRVEMDGEAYFEVVHNQSAPFIVSANGLDVKVLGTRFNVRSDQARHRVTAVLLEGSVLASASNNQRNNVQLHPMQSVTYDTHTQQMILADYTHARNSIGWIEGNLQFNQQPFCDIASELQRYYNVDITFANEALKQECFSGDFRINDGIYHIMSVLGLTYKFRYEIVGDDIILYSK